MSTDTGESERIIEEIAGRYRVGRDSVEAMLHAVVAGGGTMAQFNIAELGGYGQWMRGGMTMVGNMFDNDLRARVDRLGTELSTLYFDPPFVLQRAAAGGGRHGTDTGAPSDGGQWQSAGGPGSTSGFGGGRWWPETLGSPASSGGQNDSRYAYFPQANRLALQSGGGAVELYDTTGYDITGVSQQQGGSALSSFSTAQGPVPLDRLKRVGEASGGGAARAETPSASGSPSPDHRPSPSQQPGKESGGGHGEILDALERLGTLKEKGVLTAEEFAEKKRELLARL